MPRPRNDNTKPRPGGVGNILCPQCNSRTRVVETQGNGEGKIVIRWRRCTSQTCGEKFVTQEAVA